MTDRHSDDPSPPFTPVELEIAELAGKGYGHEKIAALTRRKVSTIRSTVWRMSLKLTPEDGVAPLARIQLWAAHRAWVMRHPKPTDSAA